MEILRSNFHEELPYIREAIKEAEFVAIDAEFSGLHTEPNKRTQTTTLEEGYEELRKSATQFLTVQIGISTFTFDPRNGSYIAKPFNFFIFPTTSVGYSPQGRCFLTEASSLDFLAKNRFDFNKWVYQGVHYMTKADEEKYRQERIKVVNNDFDVIGVDEANAVWLTDVVQRIREWKDDPKAINFINIQTFNGYQRRLVFQEIRRLWDTELHPLGQSGFINITKTTEEQVNLGRQKRQASLQKEIEYARGFRDVIDILSTCGKPIVGHNIVIDLAYILAQFVGPLPPTMGGYKKMIHETFPTVIDTKYLSSSADPIKYLVRDTSLGGLENLVNTIDFYGCPRVMPHYKHQRYLSSDLSHEAGYDAYITGTILIRMMALIAKHQPPPPAPPVASMTVPLLQADSSSKKKNGNESSRNGQQEKKPNSRGANKKRGKGAAKGQPPMESTSVGSLSASTLYAPANSTSAKLTPTQETRPAPPSKKFSYADAAQRGKTGGAPVPSATPSPIATPVANSMPLSVVGRVRDETATDFPLSHDDTLEEDGSEYDYNLQETEPELHVKPFSMESSFYKSYMNILHWGRSNHGCIHLTSA
ncbi:hypothetical protein EDD11_008551 [Mortierella claussenii]|nr:hypothetical protein EDD11_008551 [Mortierella claussenii]